MNAECHHLRDENARLRRELRARYDLSEIIGSSHAVRGLREMAAEAANADRPVLICGESGAGKELVARAIHYNSSRADQPFVKIHCATRPEGAFEGPLFGTLFLDEINRLNEHAQARLLRILRTTGHEDRQQPLATVTRMVPARA